MVDCKGYKHEFEGDELSSTNVWEGIASKLLSTGVATVDLPQHFEQVHADAFSIARTALDRVAMYDEGRKEEHDGQNDNVIQRIPSDANSAHATGYHSAGGANSLSRYNACREGFVFSDNEGLEMEGLPEFSKRMDQLSTSLHSIANRTLQALEEQLQIPPGWFQANLGPMKSSSQFHVKRYSEPEALGSTAEHGKNDKFTDNDPEPSILLPMHTDPSLISIIVHDRPGKNDGCLGLQVYQKSMSAGEPNWTEIPFHGHGVAIVLVGSVLSYMTGNTIPSVKHRVIKTSTISPQDRMAATLFVRPRLKSQLTIPPSPQLEGVSRGRKKLLSFEAWINRVSKNYGKKKK